MDVYEAKISLRIIDKQIFNFCATFRQDLIYKMLLRVIFHLVRTTVFHRPVPARSCQDW